MNESLQKLRGVLGIGLSWRAVWGTLFATIGQIFAIVDPEGIDPGESPVAAGGIGLVFGFVSGVGFGLVLSFAENRKSIGDLSVSRVAIWGLLGSSAFPLLTTMNNSLLLVACPLGAAWAAASVAIARKAERPESEQPKALKLIGRLVAQPLRAARGVVPRPSRGRRIPLHSALRSWHGSR